MSWTDIAAAVWDGDLPLHLAIWAQSPEAEQAWSALNVRDLTDVLAMMPLARERVRDLLLDRIEQVISLGSLDVQLDSLFAEARQLLTFSAHPYPWLLVLHGRAITILSALRDAQIVRENTRGYRETLVTQDILANTGISRQLWDMMVNDFAVATSSQIPLFQRTRLLQRTWESAAAWKLLPAYPPPTVIELLEAAAEMKLG